ncbi:MAG: YitT family protein [Eubacteriales bacterium]|nr:YitT family protein [Eubacteriales bacterium]MDD3073148.1 YitT family protein [Eubacteriales bacterium]MDD4078772.1 YitT family protein [Eubacteriales bacterium]MDD4769012.1 YitT family protein [Eubacteriales bacterium]
MFKKLFVGFRVTNILGIALGCLVTALAINLFLAPNQVAPGGASGLAVVMHHLLGLPVSLGLLLINLPLFILAWFLLGPRFGINTLAGSLLLPIFAALTEHLAPVTSDLLLASIYGGIIMGVGVGIVLRSQGSIGGTTLAAQLIHKFSGFSVSQCLLVIDFLVVTLVGIVFDAELALYSLIALAVSIKVIDLVQQGLRRAKAAFIISDCAEGIAAAVLEQLQRGATLLEGRGAWSRRDKEVLLVVVNSNEVARLKALVAARDPDAFVIVADIHEVLGEGFSRQAIKRGEESGRIR